MGPAILIDGSEYWFVSEPKLDHKEAELYCAVNGSQLAVIDYYTTLISIQDHLKTQWNEQTHPVMQKWWVKSANVRNHHQLILHRVLGRNHDDCSFVSAITFIPADYFHRVSCSLKLSFICKS